MKIGIMTLVTGNILMVMVAVKTWLLPRNFILAKVYAEREPRQMAMIVEALDTAKLLRMERPIYWTPGGTFMAYTPLGLAIPKSLR
jgi:hypothetical protein